MTSSDLVAPHAPHSRHLREVTARTLDVDGISIHYEVLGSDRPGAPVIVLANGLGGRLYAWEPLVDRFAASHRIVTWDYRGLFRSGSPPSTTQLSVPHHAADAARILDREGIERATFVGWSMGVQVVLHAALEHAERVERLVLLNGTYGQVFQTGLQPLFRAPLVPWLLHSLVERLGRREAGVVRALRALGQSELHLRSVGALLGLIYKNPRYEDMYRQYLHDVLGPSFPNFLRLFQVLDAHSVFHLLPEVRQPTLVVSGRLDWLTPASMSFKIARRIPGAEHLHMRLASHFMLLEYPEEVLGRMAAFLERA